MKKRNQRTVRRTPLKLLLSGLVLGIAIAAYAQPEIILQNFNTSTNSTAISNGLFFIKVGSGAPALIEQDFNAAFYGGSNPTNLSLLATFLINNGSATGDNLA